MMTAIETPPPIKRSPRHHPGSEEGKKTRKEGDAEGRFSPWIKLAAFSVVAVIPLIVVGALRPMDRILDFLLPPEKPSSHQDNNNDTTTTLYRPPLRVPPALEFPFRQCSPNSTQLCCNGLENTCDLPIHQVGFATLHNAMTTKEDGALWTPNHYWSLESALQVGYRGFHLQVCNCQGVLEFCRQYCRLGARNPLQVFLNLNRFLRDHRQEVVVLHLELMSNNNVNDDLRQLYSLLQNATRFHRNLYHHSSPQKKWPTLRRMIQTDKRVLLFHSNGPTCANSSCPMGMHYWPDYGTETHTVLENNTATMDEASSCHSLEETTKPFRAIRHHLATPDPRRAAQLNDYEFLQKQIGSCTTNPAFHMLSVDFWSVGNVVEFVQRQNKARMAETT